jgi:Transposase DDE domain
MERELWPILYHAVCEVARGFRQKYVQIPGWVLVVTMLWASLHDRPVSWACKPINWSTTRLRPERLPSAATMSRRVDGVTLGWLWCAVEERLRELSARYPALVAFLDGKPLPVGGNTKDRDAHYGRAAGTMAKGYKLHTVWSNRSMPEAWELTPMNTCEKVVARRLIPQLRHGGYLLADGNYDASDLYDLADAQGYRLVAPPRKGNAGTGHHYQSPHRLRDIAMLRDDFGKSLYAQRRAIEEFFGNATSFGGGLAPLPAWVRGLDRVRTWVWAKLLINAARILYNKDLRHP